MDVHEIIPALDRIMALIDDLLPIPPPPTPRPPPPPIQKNEELERRAVEVVREIGIIDNALVEMQRAFRQGSRKRAALYLLAYLDVVVARQPSLKNELEPMIQCVLAKLPVYFSS